MKRKEAKKIVNQLLIDADVPKKIKKSFVNIVQRLGNAGCSVAPDIRHGELQGWNLMKNGLHFHFLTDSLTFEQLKGVSIRIDSVLTQMPE